MVKNVKPGALTRSSDIRRKIPTQMLSNGLEFRACKRICVSDKFERWNNRLKDRSRNRGFSKPVQKSSKIVQNTTYPPLQAAHIAPRRNLFAGEFEYAWLRCMPKGLPIEPEFRAEHSSKGENYRSSGSDVMWHIICA